VPLGPAAVHHHHATTQYKSLQNALATAETKLWTF
jgi:hypothetical protein